MNLAKTPWVDRSLKSVWERVVAASPKPEWAPRLMPGKRFALEEYGCGHYGCVFPTSDPAVVAKLTSDPTEAFFVASAMSIGEWPEGIVRYYGIYRIPGEYRGRPLFILWREEATQVGKVLGTSMWRVPGGDAAAAYEYRSKVLLANNLQRFQKSAALVREVLRRNPNPFKIVEEARRQGEWAWRYVSDAEAAGRPVPISRFRGAQRVALVLRMLEEQTVTMENEYLSDQIGTALKFYLENDLLLADVHAGNIGVLEERVGKAPVITDPGHALPLSERWQSVKIPELP